LGPTCQRAEAPRRQIDPILLRVASCRRSHDPTSRAYSVLAAYRPGNSRCVTSDRSVHRCPENSPRERRDLDPTRQRAEAPTSDRPDPAARGFSFECGRLMRAFNPQPGSCSALQVRQVRFGSSGPRARARNGPYGDDRCAAATGQILADAASGRLPCPAHLVASGPALCPRRTAVVYVKQVRRDAVCECAFRGAPCHAHSLSSARRCGRSRMSPRSAVVSRASRA
jgi:hypothetical protein